MRAAYPNQPVLAEVESVEKHIYFLEVPQIDNVLSVRLYKMISLKERKSDRKLESYVAKKG